MPVRRTHAAASLLALALAACQPAAEETAAPAEPVIAQLDAGAAPAASAEVDYADLSTWLCRPGRSDACTGDLTATVVAADGTLTVEPFAAAADPAIDCFYVYPTVSLDETPNSDLVAGPEEENVVRQQFARLGEACRLYAPIYRQVTIPALRAALSGQPMNADRELAYNDAVAAWRHYLANDNAGRGVVLVGHSQGAGVLTRLVANEIEGKPAASLLVSALLIGSNLDVPADADVGGALKSTPTCRSADQTGCAIAYVSFRADQPPPATSLFGRAQAAGARAACVNPAELDGSGGALKAYLPATRTAATSSSAEPGPWTSTGAEITTPFVTAPGLLTAECVSAGGFDYLAVTTHGDPADPRADAIVGDVVVDGAVAPEWGLHLVDVNLAMGNLVAIVERQAAAWRARGGSGAQAPAQ